MDSSTEKYLFTGSLEVEGSAMNQINCMIHALAAMLIEVASVMRMSARQQALVCRDLINLCTDGLIHTVCLYGSWKVYWVKVCHKSDT